MVNDLINVAQWEEKNLIIIKKIENLNKKNDNVLSRFTHDMEGVFYDINKPQKPEKPKIHIYSPYTGKKIKNPYYEKQLNIYKEEIKKYVKELKKYNRLNKEKIKILDKKRKIIFNKLSSYQFSLNIMKDRPLIDFLFRFHQENTAYGVYFFLNSINPVLEKYSKFIEEKEEIIEFNFYYEEIKLHIRNYLIRQSIISFAEQKGYEDDAKRLKKLFMNKNSDFNSYDEYLGAKAKELLSLDPEKLLEHIQNN